MTTHIITVSYDKDWNTKIEILDFDTDTVLKTIGELKSESKLQIEYLDDGEYVPRLEVLFPLNGDNETEEWFENWRALLDEEEEAEE